MANHVVYERRFAGAFGVDQLEHPMVINVNIIWKFSGPIKKFLPLDDSDCDLEMKYTPGLPLIQ